MTNRADKAKQWREEHKAKGLCVWCNNPALPNSTVCDKHHKSRPATHRKLLYGITDKEYSQMLEAQGGVCLICKKSDGRRLSVDHNHDTGEVRGLLCGKCNAGLGQFRDNTNLLFQAIKYLKGKL